MSISINRNLEFDQPIRNTLALTKSGRTLGATWFCNGSRHFIRIIEPNPFGTDSTLRVVAVESDEAARKMFNEMQDDADAVLALLNISL